MQTTTTTIETATNPGQYTRESRYAHGADGGQASLTVSREEKRSGYSVRWNVNRGRGWAKGWKATRATEVEALAFAAEKWPTLIAWLEKVEPVEGNGAAEAFSAQVAGMTR